MDTKEILKKFWFVGLIAILFVGFIVIYIVQMIQNQPVVKSPKEVDGNYVIYSINGEDYTADEFYSDLYDQYGVSTAYDRYERYICEEAIETTSDMETIATNNAAILLEQYGDEGLAEQMRSLGYEDADDAYDYYIYLQKSMKLRSDYLLEHEDDILTPFVEANHPKQISHILITVEDITSETTDGVTTYTANPTDEEQAKLDAVLAALDEGQAFADVATEYSDDSSASSGGYLGYFDDDNTSYVTVFADMARTLTGGQVSEVITSQYGWHIIYCDTDEPSEMMDDTDFLNAIFAEYPSAYYQPLLDAASELGIEISDADLKAAIDEDIQSAMSTEEESETGSTTDPETTTDPKTTSGTESEAQ